MILTTKLPDFLPYIRQLDNNIKKPDLFNGNFLLEEENNLKMYYAPHNEIINANARIVIVGITPGWNQMKTAYESMIQSLKLGKELDDILQQTKFAAGLSGQIRKNLISMLDQIGLAAMLSLITSEKLFSEKREWLHTTSVIRYPVFLNGKNYTGHTPDIEQSSLLSRYAYKIFPEELEYIQSPALIIPLGKAVEKVMRKITEWESTNKHTYLFGFPHPSGANGHRNSQLRQNLEGLQQTVCQWSKGCKSFDN